MSNSLTQINDCGGFFLDSGGGTGTYGANENFTTTICPQGNAGTHVQLIFSAPDLELGDELCFFDGPSIFSPSLGCASDFNAGAAFIIQATAPNSSGCLTITFNSNGTGQGEGWSADINCIAACQTILSVITDSDPAIVPVDTGYINICPGDRVFFTGAGQYPQNGVVYNHSDLTSEFEWNFGDGTSTLGPSVSHVYDEPGGYVVELEITDQLGCKNTNFIKQRIRVAPKPHFELGVYDNKLCSGDTVDLWAIVNTMTMGPTVSVLPAEGTFQTGGIRSDSLPLPDGNGSSYSTTISFTDFAPGQVLTDINDLIGIFVDMEHSWMRDLQISITCPDGNSVLLHNHPGQLGGEVFLGVPYENDEGQMTPIPGIGYNYGWAVNPDYNYTWIEYANWFFPQTLPAGTYESFEPLSNLVGCPLNGDWTIEVTDLWSIDNGNIFSWSIQFKDDLFPALETFSPDLVNWSWANHESIFYQTPDSISAAPINAGEVAYTFMVEDEFGCLWDTMVNIQVLPFTHPDCYECEKLLSPFPDTTICLGGSVDLDVSTPLLNDDITFESYDYYEIGASNHPPASPYISTINVNSIHPLNISNPAVDIVSICLDLETDFDADINIYLVAPTGQLFMLSTNNGGGGDNYTQTCFTPTAVTPITAGIAPFTGEYLPEANWSALTGLPINGSWSLRISDQFGVNAIGRLNWWSITFRTDNEVTYDWSPAIGLSCTDCPNPTAMPDVTTNYTVTASDIYGCSTEEEIEINVQIDYFAPDVQMTDFPGGIVEITWNDVNPGNGYEVNINNTGWVPSNNGNLAHMINGLNFGDVINAQVRSLVLTTACTIGIGMSSITYSFCSVTATITTPPPYEVQCYNSCDESIQISAVGVAPFSFNVMGPGGNNFTQPTGNLVDLCSGDYTVVVTDATGCTDMVQFSVANKSIITVSPSQQSAVSCFGESDGCGTVVATGGVGGYTFTWLDPNMSIGQTVCGLPAGFIQVTATDANGCVGNGATTITQPPLLEVSVTFTDVNCTGGNDGTATATVTGGTAPYTYTWSSGDTPNDPTTGGLTAGNYTLIVRDKNDCEVTADVDISEPLNGLQLTITSERGCFGENTNKASVAVVGGTAPYDYAWMPTGATTPAIDNLPNGNFTVTVTDAKGCTETATVAVDDLDAIAIELAFTPPACHNGNDGAMAVNIATGGTGMGYTFQWSTGDQDDFINGLTGGLVYSVTVTDSRGCSGTNSRLLPNPDPMAPDATLSDVSCNGLGDGEITINSVANSNGDVTYQWGPATGNQTTATVVGLTAGDYSLVVTDTEGCTISTIYSIEEPDAIVADYSIVKNDCFGASDGSVDSQVSGGTGPYSFIWSNGTTSAKLTDVPSDLYYVTITDANQCQYLDSVFVDQPAVVTITPMVEDASCFGSKDGSVTAEAIGGTAPYKYSLDGTQFFGSKTLIALEAGDYRVYVKDANDCVYTADFAINQPPELSVVIFANNVTDDELTIISGETVALDAEVNNAMGMVSYDWSASWCSSLTCAAADTTDCGINIDCPNPTAFPDYTNDYFLLIEDENGCKAEDQVQIHVRKIRSVVVPTGFSPNGDNINNRLSVHGRSGTMIDLFQVFDRWGELVYQDTDIQVNDVLRGWDGTFKSKDMPPGVYVWYLEATYEDGMKESFKGETTLIR
jgi:gliding motility-associated-like protein